MGLSVAAVAGCPGHARDDPPTTPDPSRVTTTGGDSVDVLLAPMVLREGEDGPRAFYRLSNAGGSDATVVGRTVLTIDDGGTYEAAGVVDVPAGGEAPSSTAP